MNRKERILVIGAGLCGSLLAVKLAQYGYEVILVEKRSDMRSGTMDSGRSINLALSDRGLTALSLAGLDDDVQKLLIPMPGRMLHDDESNTRFSPYSGRDKDFINSISRTGLNSLLLDVADSYDNLELLFDSACQDVLYDENAAIFKHSEKGEYRVDADIIFGADGAGSVVRHSMEEIADKKNIGFQNDSEFLTYGYKELSFEPTESGNWAIEDNALHIWPRGQFMMIALPNLDGSFTVTLFLPYKGEDFSFEALEDREKRQEFFKNYFPDSLKLFGDLDKEYEENPVGKLGTVRCQPWAITDSVCLIGDAAHAIVPFYGQGMNCAFEDVTVLDSLLKKHKHNWPVVIETFAKHRKIDADAIADLAIDNFYEMRDHVARPQFAKKREIEMEMESSYEDYYSKYSLVTFREDLSYFRALNQGRFQDDFILNLLEEKPEITASEVYKRLKAEFSNHPEYSLTEHKT